MKHRSKSNILFILVLIRIFIFMNMKSMSSCSRVEELCGELIPENYEVYKAPQNEGKPLKVFVGFQVLDIGEIDEENMDYHFHVFIVYAWNDTRLKLDKYKVLGRTAILYSKCKDYIWTPDVYYETAKKIETFQRTSPTTILNIFEDGSVVMSVRYSFKSNCFMEFDDYPFDTQTCNFLVSLMYSRDSIVTLKWLDDKDCPIRDPPIQMMREIDDMKFYLLDPTWRSLTKVGGDGNRTSLEAEFTLTRRLTGCIISTFAPSLIIVIMSWVTFWIKTDAIPARVALSITSLLTLCTQTEQSKTQLPSVNYVTAMDIWLFMCITSVFTSLIVTALSYNVFSMKCTACTSFKKVDKAYYKSNKGTSRFDQKNSPWILNNTKRPLKIIYAGNSYSSPETNSLKGKMCTTCLSYQKLSQRIDDTSKLAFPGSFLFATICYSSYYLHSYNNHF